MAKSFREFNDGVNFEAFGRKLIGDMNELKATPRNSGDFWDAKVLEGFPEVGRLLIAMNVPKGISGILKGDLGLPYDEIMQRYQDFLTGLRVDAWKDPAFDRMSQIFLQNPQGTYRVGINVSRGTSRGSEELLVFQRSEALRSPDPTCTFTLKPGGVQIEAHYLHPQVDMSMAAWFKRKGMTVIPTQRQQFNPKYQSFANRFFR